MDITELKEGDLILVNPGIRFLQIEKYRRRASWETVILLREVPLKNPRLKMATTLVFYLGGSGRDHHFNLVVEMGKRLDNIKSKNNENQII